MRNTLIIAMLIFAVCCYGQEVVITKKDSTQLATKITAHSQTTLYFSNGSIKMAELAAIDFKVNNAKDEKLYETLKAAGIAVTFTGKTYTPPKAVSPIIVQQTATGPVTTIAIDFEKFRQERQQAKVTQLAGLLAIGTSIILQSVYNQQYKDDLKNDPTNAEQKYVSPILPGAGLAVFTLGIALDINAGRHLKQH